MRSGHDRTGNRGLETLLSINELVFQDGPVVADHIKRKASVVIFVADTPAAAVIEQVVAEQALVVSIPEALSVYYRPTRGLLIGEAGGRDGYSRPSSCTVVARATGGPRGPSGRNPPDYARHAPERQGSGDLERIAVPPCLEGEPVSYYLCKRGGIPVMEWVIFYTTRQREEVG